MTLLFMAHWPCDNLFHAFCAMGCCTTPSPTHQSPVEHGSVYELPAWYLTRGRHPSDPIWERTQWRKWLLNGFSRRFKCVCSQKDAVKNSKVSMDDFIRISSKCRNHKLPHYPFLQAQKTEGWCIVLIRVRHRYEQRSPILSSPREGCLAYTPSDPPEWNTDFCPSFILLLW